jgi:predicted MPP superfamily phosphohydrolase
MKLAQLEPAERARLTELEARIGRVHLEQRLGLEGDHEARVFRRGTHFFHLENWYSAHSLMRLALRAAGVHRRGLRNALSIQLRHNTVALRRLPPAFESYTVLHLSDLHLDMNARLVDALLERIRGLDYDVCVMTGDFRYRTFGPFAPAMAALGRLVPHLRGPAYAVLGNHDSIRMVPHIEDFGVRVLLNESVAVTRGEDTLFLAGIDDAHYFRTHSLHKAAHDIPREACAVLLSHTPEPYRHAAHADFSLMLSGHTHGGQICLPGGIPVLTDCDAPRAFARGAWRYHELVGYTSVGCGSSIVDARLNCLPEVTLHRLHRETLPQ